MLPPLISLEEHYYSEAVYNSFGGSLKAGIEARPEGKQKVFDLGSERLKDMDSGKVALQVVSHSTSVNPDLNVCRAGNDQLAQDISKNGDDAERFAGFAVLPMSDPQAAADELERTVRRHGFVGALIDHKVGNKFFDGEEYDIFWAMAQHLDVPIYLHPAWPTDEIFQQSYAGNYSQVAMSMLGSAVYGWHAELGLHVLRLYAAGLFDRYPKLKIIIGHFGEMLPFMLHRVQSMSAALGKHQRSFVQAWKENIWITTSGVWSLDPLRCILANTDIEHIMYSVDYPYTSNEKGLEWMEDLERSGLVTPDELSLIAYKNAERLLGVKVPSS